jgi:hypothetical protein
LALGGRTVGELKAVMSASEFASWLAYVEDNGPLDLQRRYDEPAALIAWAVQAAQGGKAKLEDFLRFKHKNQHSSIDNAIAKLFGVKV